MHPIIDNFELMQVINFPTFDILRFAFAANLPYVTESHDLSS